MVAQLIYLQAGRKYLFIIFAGRPDIWQMNIFDKTENFGKSLRTDSYRQTIE